MRGIDATMTAVLLYVAASVVASLLVGAWLGALRDANRSDGGDGPAG